MDLIETLRYFPLHIDHGQQAAFSTLAHLLESFQTEVRAQQRLMENHSGKSEGDFRICDRSEVIRSIWSSITLIHQIGKLSRSEKHFLNPIYQSSKFRSIAEHATKLRDQRDHIHNNLGNLRKKKVLIPLNGVITWTFAPQVEQEKLKVKIQAFSIDPILKKFSVDILGSFEEIKYPFDNLTIFALKRNST
ncbi:hypothetical protein R5H30_17110 [Sulfitobacter sp. D35]|uniref:hypothetical protein n=1 Tax=Sulfitobacter sp. D35 TaxID=3083252 RepID=UPI00296EEDC3|nr:hypothetical protein [Sulfitobacter sp. D35]MDW4499717.1 hypothetical protein [Sulfitobacter sp. D35]